MRTRINWTGGQPHITPVELSWSGGRPVYRTGASAWLAGGYAFRRPIKVKNRHIDEDLDDFPLLVQFGGDWRLGRACRSDGYDVAFTDLDGKSTLPYEREYFGISNRMAEGYYWVRKDLACRGDNLLYMYYGKGDASDGESPTDVWDANFKAVWHLAESGNPYLDSTSNNNDSTAGAYPEQKDAKIYKGQDFELGDSEFISMPDSASLDISTNLTISAWIRRESLSDFKAITGKMATGNRVLYFAIDASHYLTLRIDTNIGTFYTLGTTAINNTDWHHVAGVANQATGNGYVYLDGSQDGTLVHSYSTLSTNNDAFNIGRNEQWGEYWDGFIDEVRISDKARSAAWTKFCYRSQVSPHEIEIGEEETPARVIRHG